LGHAVNGLGKDQLPPGFSSLAQMAPWNALLDVEKAKQPALIAALPTHHHPTRCRDSQRNGIMIRRLFRRPFQQYRSIAAAGHCGIAASHPVPPQLLESRFFQCARPPRWRHAMAPGHGVCAARHHQCRIVWPDGFFVPSDERLLHRHDLIQMARQGRERLRCRRPIVER
jgi:hypothetical protein